MFEMHVGYAASAECVSLMAVRWPPFYDDNPFGIYEKIVSGKVNYPSSLDSVAKDIIRKVLRPHARTSPLQRHSSWSLTRPSASAA